MAKKKQYVVTMAAEVTFYIDVEVEAGSRREAVELAKVRAPDATFDWSKTDQGEYRVAYVAIDRKPS